MSFGIPVSSASTGGVCIENGQVGHDCVNLAPKDEVTLTGADVSETSPTTTSVTKPLSASEMQSQLQVGGGDNSANTDTNVTLKDNFLRNIQVYIMGLLGIVSVSVFLYIGYMLFTAQGKEEDFKKAWTALVYAVIGLAVIPLAFIAVKIVTGFTF